MSDTYNSDLHLPPGDVFDTDWGENPDGYVPGPMDRIINPNNLHKAYLECRRSVGWKRSVQLYGLNELSNIVDIMNRIENGTYELDKPYEFVLDERGHNRYIKALTIMDRVVQRSFNDNVLVPAVKPYLIYDNGASQKGKGVQFARDRFKYHLRNAYQEFGPDGYIMIIDFSKYFDNILHDMMLAQFKPLMSEDEFKFLQLTFHSFEVDVSYMSDEELMNYKDSLFNMLEYHAIDKKLLTGEKMMPKSIGIGNQTSQMSGIFYPHEMDNYCKIVKGIKYYGRYMDDTYIMARTKQELKDLYKDIEAICTKFGIHINPKKLKLQPLRCQVTYLKINYQIIETGRIFEFVPNHIFEHERQNIQKLKYLYDKQKLDLLDVLQCFMSWEGSYSKFDSKRKVFEMELYFKQVFGIGYKENLSEMFHTIYTNQKAEKDKKAKWILRRF